MVTLVTPITNIITIYMTITKLITIYDWYDSYEISFLFRVNMSKLFYSFRVGLKGTYYGTHKFLLTGIFVKRYL